MKTYFTLLFLCLLIIAGISTIALIEMKAFNLDTFPTKLFNSSMKRVDKGALVGHQDVLWYEETTDFLSAKQEYHQMHQFNMKVTQSKNVPLIVYILLFMFSLIQFFRAKNHSWYIWVQLAISSIFLMGIYILMAYSFPELDTLIYEITKNEGFRDQYKLGRLLNTVEAASLSLAIIIFSTTLITIGYVIKYFLFRTQHKSLQ